MTNLLSHLDPILRGAPSGERGSRSARLVETGAVVVICSAIYGGSMGSWGLFGAGSEPETWLWSVYSAVKVPLLLVATFALSLPVLWISYTLAGMREELGRVLGALVEMQAGLAAILGSLAPFTLLWYASSSNYQIGVVFNALMFAVATITARSLPRRNLIALLRENSRHKPLLTLWLVVFIFTGIQMGWSLRPFIGSPGSAVTFLRLDEIDNAWVNVAELIWSALGG